MTVSKLNPHNNTPAISQDEVEVACSFVATLDSLADIVTVKALVSSKDRAVQLRLIMAVLQTAIQEIVKDYDAPSCARMLTQYLITALKNVDPEAADAIASLQKNSLPKLGN